MNHAQEHTRSWEPALAHAIQLYLEQTAVKHGVIDRSHIADTPERMVRAFKFQVDGCDQDPRTHLQRQFANGDYDEMVVVHEIRLVSLCAHHGAPIFGKIDFAYLPGDHIVGLSKIPRFIRVLLRRPQVQENIARQIVDIFQDTVQPQGCGVRVRAYHGCMMFRGAEEPMSYTTTNALKGVFKSQPSTRSEFFRSLPNTPVFP